MRFSICPELQNGVRKNNVNLHQKMMKKTHLTLSLFLALFLFTACTKSVVFDEKVVFPNANWAFENKAITFKVPLAGSDKPHSIVLELELNGTPNIEKFYATFRITTPKEGETVKSILFNFACPNEPYIKGASSNEMIYRLTVYPKKYFSETGTYFFEVNQFSNKADNYGIRALRMVIKKAKE